MDEGGRRKKPDTGYRIPERARKVIRAAELRAFNGKWQTLTTALRAGSRSIVAFGLLASIDLTRMRITIWNVIYLAGFIVYGAIRGVFEARTKSNENAVSRAGILDRALLVPVFLGNVVLPALYLFTPWLAFADYQLPLFLQCCGTITMIFALWLFWRAHADLGLNWSITLEMRKEHELITNGVYRRIRHPMYAAIFLFAAAQGFLLQNCLAGWGGFVTFGLLYLIRAPREERMMEEVFGESYRDYVERTGRLWPRVREVKGSRKFE